MSGGGGATLPAQLLERARQSPAGVAYRHKRLGVWETTTWAAYAADAAAIGLALEALGVRSGDRVAVAAGNRPEWVVADLGIQGIGAVTVGVHPKTPTAEVGCLLSHTAARAVVCEDEEQLDKVMEVRAGLPDLVSVVVVDTRGVRRGDDPRLHTWQDLIARGKELDASVWQARVEALDPDATALELCSSRTTGPPTGAVLNSSSLVAAGAAFRAVFSCTPRDEVLSYLPLSHPAERLTSLIAALAVGYVVNFGENGDSFAHDLREVQPTLFLGVPRVWDEMLATTETRMADASPLKRSVYRWCTARGRTVTARRAASATRPADPLLRALCWLLCFRQLRRKLGLGRITTAVSTTGPVEPDVREWFRALGVELREWDRADGTALAELVPLVVPA